MTTTPQNIETYYEVLWGVEEDAMLDTTSIPYGGNHGSRCVSWPTSDRPGWLTTAVLLRSGADPTAVAAVLAALPGAEIRCGTAMVAVYRRREA